MFYIRDSTKFGNRQCGVVSFWEEPESQRRIRQRSVKWGIHEIPLEFHCSSIGIMWIHHLTDSMEWFHTTKHSNDVISNFCTTTNVQWNGYPFQQKFQTSLESVTFKCAGVLNKYDKKIPKIDNDTLSRRNSSDSCFDEEQEGLPTWKNFKIEVP